MSNNRKGSAALEFALSFLMLWTILSGVFQFGYAMYIYNSLECAVVGAGRYAARVDFDSPAHTFVTQVKNIAVYGNPSGTGTALAPGLTTAKVNVTWTVDSMGVPQTITVAISSYRVDAIFKSYIFTNKPRITVSYLGSYKTPAT